MKRKEERVKYAMSFKGRDMENEELKENIRLAILDGAVWADKTMIEKACKWLKPIFTEYAGYYVGGELLNNFRKAMEE